MASRRRRELIQVAVVTFIAILLRQLHMAEVSEGQTAWLVPTRTQSPPAQGPRLKALPQGCAVATPLQTAFLAVGVGSLLTFFRPRRCSVQRAAAAATITKEEESLKKFVDWLAARGGKLDNVEIRSMDGMRGLFAARDMAEGEIIVDIPIEASIDLSDETNRMGKDPSTIAINLLKVLEENRAADSSQDLSPYLDLLPGRDSPDMMRMPDFFSDDELQMLQCPVVQEKTLTRRQLCEARAAEHSLSNGDLTWALCTTAQRVFSVLSPVDGLLRLLLPGIDLFNHDAHAQHRMKVAWNLEGYVTAHFKVMAGSPIRKGEEVRICYGGSPFRPDGCGGDCSGDIALNNAAYLQRYGFVDECFGTTMVDGKWLVTDEAASIRKRLAETSIEQDEALLGDESLSLATQTALKFRRHLKRGLAAQQEADRQAAKAEASKTEAQKLAEKQKKEQEEAEAKAKEANAAEAKKQLLQAMSAEN